MTMINMVGDLINKLQAASLRVTPQRLAVLEMLANDYSHPNAEIVYQKLKKQYPAISFDTVNRTLNTFVQKGLLGSVEGHGDPKRYDASTLPHHHFRCVECGSITDFKCVRYDALPLPQEVVGASRIVRKRVVLEGICNKCKK